MVVKDFLFPSVIPRSLPVERRRLRAIEPLNTVDSQQTAVPWLPWIPTYQSGNALGWREDRCSQRPVRKGTPAGRFLLPGLLLGCIISSLGGIVKRYFTTEQYFFLTNYCRRVMVELPK